MIRFGTVGTGRITELFLRAGSLHPEFQLGAVCSRTLERAAEFGAQHGCSRIFDSPLEMAYSGAIDAVYIATPNALHRQHALTFLQSRIPVLCERPLACCRREAEEMINAARRTDTLLMHGMEYTLTPQFSALREALPRIGPIRQIVASHCRYKPGYDNYKTGVLENAFRPELGNGAMMDYGFSFVYRMVTLMGLPDHIKAEAHLLDSGIDGSGSLIARYGGAVVSLNFSKISDGRNPYQIAGEYGSLFIAPPDMKPSMKIQLRDQPEVDVPFHQIEYHIYYEIAEFIRLLNEGRTQSDINSFQTDLDSLTVTDEYRRQVGLHFPCDGQQGV